MHFNGRVSLLGVEERELRIKDCNAYPPASKHYVKRVLINPGSKYRIKVIPPVLEVRLQLLSFVPNHDSRPETITHMHMHNRHGAMSWLAIVMQRSWCKRCG